MHVFIDESGDLGFTERSTKFFIVAYLTCESPHKLRVEMKRVLRHLHQKNEYSRARNELKFSRMDRACRKYVLNKISECDVNFGVVVIEKAMMNAELRKEPAVFYRWSIVHNVVLSLVSQIVTNRKIQLVFDKGLPTWKITEFNSYIRNKVSYLLGDQQAELAPDYIVIKHLSSELESCLQGADAIAGAYFQKFENQDDEYVRLIENKVSAFKYLWRK